VLQKEGDCVPALVYRVSTGLTGCQGVVQAVSEEEVSDSASVLEEDDP
jgi:hypothetical protein